MANPDYPAGAFQKDPPGTLAIERRKRRRSLTSREKAEKAKVVVRDGEHYCRLVPGCREVSKHETAHVEPKGMGGDHGKRTNTRNMLRACTWHHRGAVSIHSGHLRVEYLSADGCDGPIQVMKRFPDGEWRLFARERRVGLWERFRGR